MPVYEYKCEKGHQFEVLQKMSDDPVTKCEVCGKPVQRVFHPVAVHFKGSGFYNTDYGKQKRGGSGSSSSDGDSSSSSSSSESSSSNGSSKSSDAKSSDSKSGASAPAKSAD
jgi:putative FmdB family regulatory protein